MNIEELNKYLSKLEGPGLIKNISINEKSNIDELTIKFYGDTGTFDLGEIEVTFYGIEIINLPQGFMTPVNIRIASSEEVINIFNLNYLESSCSLFKIQDSEGISWHIYAESYKANILPVYYGK
jgi:hypothetical protein